MVGPGPSLLSLPDELLQRVFKHTDLPSLLTLPSVCKRVRAVLAVGSIAYERLTIGPGQGYSDVNEDWGRNTIDPALLFAWFRSRGTFVKYLTFQCETEECEYNYPQGGTAPWTLCMLPFMPGLESCWIGGPCDPAAPTLLAGCQFLTSLVMLMPLGWPHTSGLQRLSALQHLQDLVLQLLHDEGSVPDMSFLSRLAPLTSLRLKDPGTNLCAGLANMTALRSLIITMHAARNEMRELPLFPSLTNLDLNGDDVDDPVGIALPLSISKCTALRFLRLSCVDANEADPSPLDALRVPHLEELNITYCMLKHFFPVFLRYNCSLLRKILIYNINVAEPTAGPLRFPDEFSSLTSLRKLTLCPEGVEHYVQVCTTVLCAMTFLEELSLSRTISLVLPQDLGSCLCKQRQGTWELVSPTPVKLLPQYSDAFEFVSQYLR